MANKFWPATALTGGTDGALDAIDGAELTVGDAAMVMLDGVVRFYRCETSTATENSPRTIAPDTNGSSLRWVLVTSIDGNEMYPLVIGNGASADGQGTAYGHWASAADYSVAIGGSAVAGDTASSKMSAVAIGEYAQGTGNESIAIGFGTGASANGAVAIAGTASGADSVAIRGTASGVDAIAIGIGSQANNEYSMALGRGALAQNGADRSNVIGVGVQVYSQDSWAVGGFPIVTGRVGQGFGTWKAGPSSVLCLTGHDLSAGGSVTVDLPSGDDGTWVRSVRFFPEECGLVVLTAGPPDLNVTVQPTVSFGTSSNPTLFVNNVQTSGLTEYGDVFRITSLNSYDGVLGTLQFTINTSATADALIAMAYFKGFFMTIGDSVAST